jgi:hypothetical protein
VQDFVEGPLDRLGANIQTLYRERPDWRTLPKNTGFCNAFRRLCPAHGECKPESRLISSLFKGDRKVDFTKSMTDSFPGAKKAPPPPAKKAPAPPSKGPELNIPAGVNDAESRAEVEAYRGRPTPDAGFVNPPGGKLAASPEEAAKNQNIQPPVEETPADDDLTTLNRDQLKALAVSLKLLDASSRKGEVSLREIIRAHREEAAIKGELDAAVTEEMNHPADPEAASDRSMAAQKALMDHASKQPVLEKLPQEIQAPIAKQNAGFRLYINCAPINLESSGTSALGLEHIVRKANANIKDEDGNPLGDYRLAPYGTGPGLLCLSVRELFESGAFAKAVCVYIDTRTPEGAVLVSELIAIAGPDNAIRAFV